MGTVDLRDFPILTQISHPDQAVPLFPPLFPQIRPSLFSPYSARFPYSHADKSPRSGCPSFPPVPGNLARSWRFTTTSPASGSARFDGAVRRTVWRGRT